MMESIKHFAVDFSFSGSHHCQEPGEPDDILQSQKRMELCGDCPDNAHLLLTSRHSLWSIAYKLLLTLTLFLLFDELPLDKLVSHSPQMKHEVEN
jgi:hypothetical protein